MPIAWKGRIESTSQEGLGVGTMITVQDGKSVKRPIFVPFTAPGDEIEAEVTEQKRKYTFGTLKSVTAPSPSRAVPQCPHFTVCGGCNLQHIDYEEQLRQKASQIQFLLTRKGIVLPHDVKVLPAKQRRNYRWRAKVAVQFTGGRIIAGFRRFHSHDVIPISTCMIVAPEIMQLITLLNRTESRIAMPDAQEIIVVVGESKKLGLLVPLDETPEHLRKQVRDFFEDIYGRNRRLIGNLFYEEKHATRSAGQVQEHIQYKAGGLTYSFLPETFIQSNVPTNETLINVALSFLEPEQGSVVIDLYAGLGNISLPAAKRAKQVIAVEGHEASVLVGRINAYQNGIENVHFIHRSTEKYLYEYNKAMRAGAASEDYARAEKLIIDPPRTGCTPDALKGLLLSGAERIVYISCNPVTLATDLQKLTERYKVTDIVGIDMFPDISHAETVVRLDLK